MDRSRVAIIIGNCGEPGGRSKHSRRRRGEDEGEPTGEERQHGTVVCHGIAVDGERSVVSVGR